MLTDRININQFVQRIHSFNWYKRSCFQYKVVDFVWYHLLRPKCRKLKDFLAICLQTLRFFVPREKMQFLELAWLTLAHIGLQVFLHLSSVIRRLAILPCDHLQLIFVGHSVSIRNWRGEDFFSPPQKQQHYQTSVRADVIS